MKTPKVTPQATPTRESAGTGSAVAVLPTAVNLRHRKIAEAAYFLAEQRGFEAGHELDDWFAAEQALAEEQGAS
jgi:hypothetical protein